MWSSSRILWDQQILLLWILLTPVFVAGVLLTFAAPFLFGDTAIRDVGGQAPANQPEPISEPQGRKAA